MLERLLREVASSDCAMSGEQSYFFSLGDSSEQAFNLKWNTVGVHRKADEYEGKLIQFLNFVHR